MSPIQIKRVAGNQAEDAKRIGLIKITQSSAKFLYDNGIPITIVGNNVNSFHFYGGWHLAFDITPEPEGRSFASLVGNWQNYNENSETGTAAFFASKKNYDRAVALAASARSAAPKSTGPKKRRKSSPGMDTVTKRRVLRAAAKHGVKLTPAQIRAASNERSYGKHGFSDPIRYRAEKIAGHRRAYTPEESRAMAQKYEYFEGSTFDPRNQGQASQHREFMALPRPRLPNPSPKRRVKKTRR